MAIPTDAAEFFLVERYLLYAIRNHQLLTGRVHHPPYPLRAARILSLEESLVSATGITPQPFTHALYSPGVDVNVHPLRTSIGNVSRGHRPQPLTTVCEPEPNNISLISPKKPIFDATFVVIVVGARSPTKRASKNRRSRDIMALVRLKDLKIKMKTPALILASLAVVATVGAQDIGVSVDGHPIRFVGTQPRMVNNSVLVPLRGVFEEMGAEVRWNPKKQEVTANKDGKIIRLIIGERMADVGGRAVQLNTPAQLRNGTTLVPLRFLSEALGAQVRWNPNKEMVLIQTDGGRAQPIRGGGNTEAPRRDAVATLYKATVIPVRLNTELASNESRAGDKFTVTIDSDNGVYGNLPTGTKIEGRVVTATKRKGDDPGLLELSFDRLIMPSGGSQDLSGTLVSLTDKGLKKDADGRIVATGKAKDNKGVYAGYGAGAGLIVGLLGRDNLKGALTKSILGGLLGLGAGAVQEQQNKGPKDVKLAQGTKFGVRLDEDLTIYRDR